MSTSLGARRRLDPDERRAQLVRAGLELTRRRPFDEIGPAEVARAVGVSKGLVFHYFPTGRDLQVAVARAGAAELLEALATDPARSQEERVTIGLEAFIGYIERHPAAYRAVARGAGASQELLEVYEGTRGEIVSLITEGLGRPDPSPALRIAIRGWIAGVEEAVLAWLDAGRPVGRNDLVGLLRRSGLGMVESVLALEEPP